jgi:hypothetical protein
VPVTYPGIGSVPKLGGARAISLPRRGMAVIAHVVLHGLTKDDYDRVREAVGWLEEPPHGGLIHQTWWQDGDCHNLDSRAARAP